MKNRFLAVVLTSVSLGATAFAQTGSLVATGGVFRGDAAYARLDPTDEQHLFPLLVPVGIVLLVAAAYGTEQQTQLVAIPAQSVEPLFDR